MSAIKSYIKKLDVSLKKKYIKNNFKDLDFVLVCTPRHGNVGDQAITLAEMNFINSRFPKAKWKEIMAYELWRYMDVYKTVISKETVIVVHGGGFLGTIWLNEENLVRLLLQSFPENKVIIMPQTIFYEDSSEGNAELTISQRIYREHQGEITMFLRDKASYDFACENFDGVDNKYYVPDMVFSLKPELKCIRGNAALMCFRSDREKVFDNSLIDNIKSIVSQKGIMQSDTDTVIGKRVYSRDREDVVESKLVEFAISRFVITDRLHGMIMCAITGTPCLAVDNLSHKVSGGYDWIKKLPYIKVADSKCDIGREIDELISISENEWTYDNSFLNDEYDKIEAELKRLLGMFTS
ncbi:polysaccharide pyruvyl transferase family protein [Butyrivibrio sp. VCB2006]|uniref:polysaccharide pyruvyl transferase family protein n=1 Tax=Butyrivibrio sp. VCB2006 TaxID=1280679 RepID=UPI00041CC2D9|nr:polysaccharide pyruvyl transferase family protein [Butyrivibrio sp. VCB2006]